MEHAGAPLIKAVAGGWAGLGVGVRRALDKRRKLCDGAAQLWHDVLAELYKDRFAREAAPSRDIIVICYCAIELVHHVTSTGAGDCYEC